MKDFSTNRLDHILTNYSLTQYREEPFIKSQLEKFFYHVEKRDPAQDQDQISLTPGQLEFFLEIGSTTLKISKEILGREISHEISNPLTAIMINQDFLSSTVTDPEVREVIDSFENSLTKIRGTLEDIRVKIHQPASEDLSSGRIDVLLEMLSLMSLPQNTQYSLNIIIEKDINISQLIHEFVLFVIYHLRSVLAGHQNLIMLYKSDNNPVFSIITTEPELCQIIENEAYKRAILDSEYNSKSVLLNVLIKKISQYKGIFDFKNRQESAILQFLFQS